MTPIFSALLALSPMALQTPGVAPQDSLRELQVASLTIGGDTGAVRRRLGVPEAVTARPLGEGRVVMWTYRDLKLSFGEVRGNSQLDEIEIRTRRYATHRGVRIGDSRARVYERYGTQFVEEGCPRAGDEQAWLQYPVASVAGRTYAVTVTLQADTVSSLRIALLLEPFCIGSRSNPRLQLAGATCKEEIPLRGD